MKYTRKTKVGPDEIFEVGDKVRIKSTDGYYNGRIGTIASFEHHEAWVQMMGRTNLIGMHFPLDQLIKIKA